MSLSREQLEQFIDALKESGSSLSLGVAGAGEEDTDLAYVQNATIDSVGSDLEQLSGALKALFQDHSDSISEAIRRITLKEGQTEKTIADELGIDDYNPVIDAVPADQGANPAQQTQNSNILVKTAVACTRKPADLATGTVYKATTFIPANFLVNAGCYLFAQVPAELTKDALLLIAMPFKAIANAGIYVANRLDGSSIGFYPYSINAIFSKEGWRPSTGFRDVVGITEDSRSAKVLDALDTAVKSVYTVAFQALIVFPVLGATNAIRLVAAPITLPAHLLGADVGGMGASQLKGDLDALFCRGGETLADRFAGSHQVKTAAAV